MSGPLDGIRVLELAGMGPAPFAGMVLSDLGADVLRLDRKNDVEPEAQGPSDDLLARNRRSAAVNLKHSAGVELVLSLVEKADVFLEGFRPGVVERLGVGPDVCLARNPRLVYGRMTGWGQDGPYAQSAGHDVNYIALAGVLHPIGPAGGSPVIPLNLVGDFGGGGMLLAFGVVCALLEAVGSGRGQVVDAAMVDGAALLSTVIHQLRGSGEWEDRRGVNALDGGAPFYNVYETSDGEHVTVGALEPQFYAELVRLAGFESLDEPARWDRSCWETRRDRAAAIFRTKTRAEWCLLMEHSDACFAPVLSIPEAARHPHNVRRGTFVEVEGKLQPAPAPRFSRTPGRIHRPPARPGQHTDEALRDWGIEHRHIDQLRGSGAIA